MSTVRVLYLEDSKFIPRLVAAQLGAAGLDVDIEQVDGRAGYEQALARGGFDLILLDCVLPGFDGRTALTLARARLPDVPVIMISGALEEESIVDCLRQGAIDYILKGNMTRLGPAVHRALEEAGRQRAHRDALAALRAAETRLGDIATTIPGGVFQFVRHADGRYALPYVSPKFERMLGVTAAEVAGNLAPLFARVPRAQRAPLRASVEAAAAACARWEHTVQVTGSDGEARWFRGASEPHRLADGAIVWNGIILDITEQRLAERELEQQRAWLQVLVDARTETVREQARIIDQITDAVITTDLDGHITSWNKGAERLTGYPFAEVRGRSIGLLYTRGPQAEAALAARERLLRRDDEVVESEITLRRRDGTEFLTASKLSLLRDGADQVTGIISYTTDISRARAAEDALRLEEARLRAVLDTVADAIITIDDQGLITSFNPAAEQVFGYAAVEIIGRNVSTLMPEPYRSAHDDYIRSYLDTGVAKVLGSVRELVGLRRDGSEFPLELAVAQMRVRVEGRRAFTGVVRDVTARHATESTQRLQALALEASLDGISIADARRPDLPLTYVNPAFERITGYCRDEVIGRNGRFLQGGDRQQPGLKRIRDALREHEPVRVTVRNYRKDGTLFWNEFVLAPVRDQHGVVTHVVGIVSDVSARVEAEQALRASEARFRSLVENAGDALFLYDRDGCLVDVNQEACRSLGYAREELLGRSIHEIGIGGASPDPAAIEAQLAGTGHMTAEGVHQRKDGTTFPVELRLSVVEAEGVRLVIGLARDVTERKSFEAELVHARDEAEQASQAKSQFLSRMSHELRTPLNAVLGFAELLEIDPALDVTQKDNVEEIRKAGGHLLALINDILDLARIESGRVDLSLETIAAEPLVRECLLLSEPLVNQRELRILFERGTGEDLWLRADRVRLKQVLINLLSNATKYNTPGGTVTVSLERAGDRAGIRVADTGPGIAPELLPRLFAAFDRLGADERGIEGTGIGLLIARHLVELMGGELTVHSDPGRGSAFTVMLPVARPGEQVPVVAATHPHEHTPGGPNRQTVLYIEDNPANLRLVVQILARRPGIHLLTAQEPGHGLELAAAHQPDLVLLDINLPQMSGFEVLARLKNRSACPGTPVIAISANAMPGDVERGLEAGFDAYLTKPVNVEGLLNAVDALLGAGTRARAGQAV
ncbi:MAG: PAS domain S-box protein [Gammaproteobacteria bacterium]|nr:PAS domain S-box protein [Gammaproteobacteria bacterium]